MGLQSAADRWGCLYKHLTDIMHNGPVTELTYELCEEQLYRCMAVVSLRWATFW